MEDYSPFNQFPVVSDSLTLGLIVDNSELHISMMNDDMITYHASRRDNRILRKSMKQVEKVTDIEFVRVKDAADAEMVFRRHKGMVGGVVNDAMIDMKIKDRWKMSVRKGKKYDGDLIHEFGHALGLEDSHDRSDGDAITGLRDSIMSLTRPSKMKKFSNMDLMAISDIWNEY